MLDEITRKSWLIISAICTILFVFLFRECIVEHNNYIAGFISFVLFTYSWIMYLAIWSIPIKK